MNKAIILEIAAMHDFFIPYSGTYVKITKGSRYFLDRSTNRVMIGWHGSYSPPLDMDGNSMIQGHKQLYSQNGQATR